MTKQISVITDCYSNNYNSASRTEYPTSPFPISIGKVRASMYGVAPLGLFVAVPYAHRHARMASLCQGGMQDGWRTDPNSRDFS